jgi:hypothetical protein
MATDPQIRLVDREEEHGLRVEVAGDSDRVILAQLGTPNEPSPGEDVARYPGRFVPYPRGRWLAEHIPGAEADLNDRDRQMAVAAERIGDVQEWLARYL